MAAPSWSACSAWPKLLGITTSLDLCSVDPTNEIGRLDWRSILAQVLPWVDLFTPSLDELLYMLERPKFDEAIAKAGVRALLQAEPALLSVLGERLLAMGVKIALIKLGDCGAYLRTANAAVVSGMGRTQPVDLDAWGDRELWAPCFRVQVVGTTGSGNSTIAGFISSLIRGLPPNAALTTAVAVGACNVEASNALSGVPSWETVQSRIATGWERLMFQ